MEDLSRRKWRGGGWSRYADGREVCEGRGWNHVERKGGDECPGLMFTRIMTRREASGDGAGDCR